MVMCDYDPLKCSSGDNIYKHTATDRQTLSHTHTHTDTHTHPHTNTQGFEPFAGAKG